MSARVNAHVVQTRKELDKQGQEIITISKVVLTSVREHKAETESTVANLRQEMNQSREHVNSSLNSISGEVRSRFQEWESQFQSAKQANELEIVKINKAISSLETKITARVVNNNMTATQQTSAVKTTVGQMESSVSVVGSGTSVDGVNVRYVRHGDRQSRGYLGRRQQGEGGRSFHRRGQGSMREDRNSQLSPVYKLGKHQSARVKKNVKGELPTPQNRTD